MGQLILYHVSKLRFEYLQLLINLNSTGCHTIDQVSLEDQVDDQDWKNTEHGPAIRRL